jgi:hypothetical protein
MTALLILGLFILIIILLHLSDNTCILGHHWYTEKGTYMCRSSGAKRLPGDSVHYDWQRHDEEVGYRFERHCLLCNYEEYKTKDGKWLEVPKNQGY